MITWYEYWDQSDFVPCVPLTFVVVSLISLSTPELTSRDHSDFHPRPSFLPRPRPAPIERRHAHPVAGEPPLPTHHHQARRSLTTFLSCIPLPPSSPPSIDFRNGLT